VVHAALIHSITGPAAVTHTDIASAITEATGRPVAFVDASPEAFAGALGAAGVPPWQVDGLLEDYAHYARGEAASVSPHVREITGTDPRDVGRFAEDYARAFVGT
jgi:uncharacterized protein YbjT (DUF2867 family)